MSGLGRWTRLARRAFARIGDLRVAHVPDAPTRVVRDPWPGEAGRGARLLKGELELAGAWRPLHPNSWLEIGGPDAFRAGAHGFSWIRDLRALGTDTARLRARQLVAGWIDGGYRDPIADRVDVIGTRLTAWLGHYDFFAATADDEFRQKLMTRIVLDTRALSALLPAEFIDARGLRALKGVFVAAVALPDHDAFLTRAMRFLPQEIERQLLDDGCQVERSPAAHLAALADLVEIRALLQTGGVKEPATLPLAIERMVPVLRAFRHPDGGLALFNGSKESSAVLIDLVLTQTGCRTRALSSMAEGGFQRLQAGRSVMLVDSGAPPEAGLDRFSHAGTLSFELSVGRDRMIVNCGAAPTAAEWSSALRATAAHSTLVIANVNSAELRDEGLGRRPTRVEAERHEANGAHLLETSHNGWNRLFGAIHRRRLYMSESGEDIRGEDSVEAETPQPFTIRFHLHPNVKASLQNDGATVLLRLPSGGGWRLRSEGAVLSMEESIYLGGNDARRTEQVVLTAFADSPQLIKWAISKVG